MCRAERTAALTDTALSHSQAAAATGSREKEIARKEAELAKREADLARREALARAGGTIDPFSIKNFPPCLPLLHHDISGDIPEGKRAVMRQGFFVVRVGWRGGLSAKTRS